MMYKKRLDFDFNLVLSKTLEILKEITPHRFKVLEIEILSLVSPLEPEVTLEIQQILKQRECWSLAYIPKVFTLGLHAIERQQHIETYARSNFQMTDSLMDQLDMAKKIQQLDRSYDFQSKEAFSFFNHPMHRRLRENYSAYSVSIMLHQLIESYKFTTTETADREVFTVHTDEGTTFTVTNALDKLSCNCTFTIHYRLICSHMFNVANAL